MLLNSEDILPNKMEEFWILIFVSFVATNSLEKAESVKVKLEELPLKTFDEIFGEGWWDKGEAEDLKTPAPTNFGQIEPNSTDQNTPLTESEYSGQIKPNSTDQNAPLTESQKNPKNKRTNYSVNEKFEIVKKFMRMKNDDSGEDKKSCKEIAEKFGVNVRTINQWKIKFGLSRRNPKNERKNLVEKFDQKKAELKRAGFKNSYKNQIDEMVSKQLGITERTIYRWKKELGQTTPNHKYSHNEQQELMKRYYQIKIKNSKIIDEEIAKMLKIGSCTLVNWKKQFKRQQFHQNSVDGHSVEENFGSNIQEIVNLNSGSV